MHIGKNACAGERGFSLVELLIVLVVILILSSISLFLLTGHQTLYKPDDQSLLITDMLQEARQRSLTQRETMRVEVNLTRNTVRLIDENRPLTPDDDSVLKAMSLFDNSVVRVGDRAGDIPDNPPEPFPVPTANFLPSVYVDSIGDSVATFRFLANGTVVNAGNTATGNGAVVTGATLHIWSPDEQNNANAHIARAITVIGSTGTIRLWEYDRALETSNKWKDSRRTATYGGSTGNGNANANP